ncbi:CHC2 zinc finger domain-containing protein [Chloroflexota bacterium]
MGRRIEILYHPVNVKLNKLGPGYTGICPFCGANGIADFKVSSRYQEYECDKCGAKGGIFKFLMDLRGILLEEALKEVRGIPAAGWQLRRRLS